MLIEQKLRINKEDTNNYQIVVQDGTKEVVINY